MNRRDGVNDDWADLDELLPENGKLVYKDEKPKSKWDDLDVPEMPKEERRGFSRLVKRSADPDEDSAALLKKNKHKKKRQEVSLDMIEDEDLDAIDQDEDELADVPDELVDDGEYESDLGLEGEDDEYDGGVMDDLLDVDDYVDDENTETDEEFMARQATLRGEKKSVVAKRPVRAVMPVRKTEAQIVRKEPKKVAVSVRKTEPRMVAKQPMRAVVPPREVETRIVSAPKGGKDVLPLRAREIERAAKITQAENNVELPMETSEMPEPIYEPEPHEKEDIGVLQDKLVAGFLYGAGQLEKAKVNIGKEDEKAVLAGMRDGRFGRKAQRELIKALKSPVERFGEDGVDRRLGVTAEKERRILAYHTGVGFANWRETDGVTIQEFLKRFPLPQDFDAASEGFLRVIRRNSGDVTYNDYVQAMERFKWQIYGVRQDYFEALKLLIRRSEEQITTQTGLIELDAAGIKEVLGGIRIEGDAWIEGALERKLTVPTLLHNKLTPKWKLELEGLTLAFSQAFKMPTRDVVLGYVLDGEYWKLRSFYRNALDGVWKYLPDYAMRQTGSGKFEIWCGQAYAEEMLILPAALQMRLTEIAEKGFSRSVVDNPEFIFAGTALRYGSMKEYLDTRKLARLTGAMYTEVAARPTVVFGKPSKVKQRPSEVGIADKNAQPDFLNVIHEWTTPTGLDGRVKATSFYSKDGKLEYVFYEDNRHRAWLGEVEVKSDLTSTGLRAEWAYPGDLATPVYERTVKSDGYGDDMEQKGGYISMWEKYVSKLVIVKEYLRAKLERK